MKYTLLFFSMCVLIGYDLLGPDSAPTAYEAKYGDKNALPGYLGEMIIDGQTYRSYLVPESLDAATVDLITATELERISITSSNSGPSDQRTVRILRPMAIGEADMQGEIGIRFRYTTTQGDVIHDRVECGRTVFEKLGTELQCIDVFGQDSFTFHIVPNEKM